METITKVLEDMLETFFDIIKFLNSIYGCELEEVSISDRIVAILEVKKIITKWNLTLQLHEKCNNVNTIVQRFFNGIEPLTIKGLLSMIVINDKLMPIEDYVQKLIEGEKHAALVWNIRGSTTPALIVNTFRNTFFLLNETRHIFLVKPTFTKYTKIDEVYWG